MADKHDAMRRIRFQNRCDAMVKAQRRVRRFSATQVMWAAVIGMVCGVYVGAWLAVQVIASAVS